MPLLSAFTASKALANVGETGYQTGPRNAVKPFGNSQKGIRKGRLTWVIASDKYPGIK
jgi:hypothetical protein